MMTPPRIPSYRHWPLGPRSGRHGLWIKVAGKVYTRERPRGEWKLAKEKGAQA